MLSSEPSSQSGSPSHCHLLGTHWPLRHTKSTSAQVFLTEPVSSLPSEQSRSPSHCHTDGIHRPLQPRSQSGKIPVPSVAPHCRKQDPGGVVGSPCRGWRLVGLGVEMGGLVGGVGPEPTTPPGSCVLQ
uniref:Uncharacterized protein n=1 Tax=Sinocyclocheilus anshuiensis TaxID=1608454 RepID=A0A671T249_9TELE